MLARFKTKHAEKEVITAQEYYRMLAIVNSLRTSPRAEQFLATGSGVSELTCVWQDVTTAIWCKARLDFVQRGSRVVDLKTTLDAARDAFARSSFSFGYHLQAAHYLEAWSAAGDNERPSFLFVALEKTPPFGCSVFCMDPSSVELGRRKLDLLLERWAWCESDDDWPGYEEGIQDLSLPGYAFTREIE